MLEAVLPVVGKRITIIYQGFQKLPVLGVFTSGQVLDKFLTIYFSALACESSDCGVCVR